MEMKTIIIVGMGPGLSMGVAEKFGGMGYRIGMISRTEEKLAKLKEELAQKEIEAEYAAADVTDEEAFKQALDELKEKLGHVDVLHYNAGDTRFVGVMEDDIESLVKGYRISVLGALIAVRHLLPELKDRDGAALLTGGGTALRPAPSMASISLGKAGIRNLAKQLHKALEGEIFVGTVLVNGTISEDSDTHSPDKLAEQFWQLNKRRDEAEVVY
jgi:NADP-dependent 3-hydroxy acid dehydrogenase YdfG